MHLATAAVVNALWDLYAKLAGKPLWKLLGDMSPAQIVELVDWRYLTDALTPEDARRALDQLVPTRAAREAELRETGYPAYTTSAGWLGYSDEKIRRLCREALAAGFTRFKIKVGARPRRRHPPRGAGPPGDRAGRHADDRRQPALGRRRRHRLGALAGAVAAALDRGADQPRRRPGHAAIARALEPLGIGVATGEHCANRVDVQAVAAGARARVLPDRLLPAGRRQRDRGGAAAGRASSACRSARTRAASACASTCSTSSIFDYIAVSGIARGPRASSTSTTCTSTSSTRA